MICTEFYNGQGLGNQLWLYVVARVKASDLGCKFGIMKPEIFKGHTFLQLDFGERVVGGHGPEGGPPESLPEGITEYYSEPQSYYLRTKQISIGEDSAFLNISLNTKIDGTLQNEDYIWHRKDQIRDWLKYDENQIRSEIKSLITDSTCIINFRGGEYRHMHDVLLPRFYWENARTKMQKLNSNMKFIVVTDDPKLAKVYFDESEVLSCSMAEDYYLINNAKFLILSNSSFAWFPAWLNLHVELCIAPKFWWGFNANILWSPSYSLTRGWYYLDKSGSLSDYAQCIEEDKTGNISIANRNSTRLVTHFRKTTMWSVINTTQFFFKFMLNQRRKARTTVYLTMLINKLFKRAIQDLNDSLVRKMTRGVYTIKEFPLFTFTKGSTWIAKERKNRPVVDSFYFFNELELLKARFEFLDKYVDYFVIAESRQTFTGQTKPMFFLDNRELFSKYKDKIIHFEVPAAPLTRKDATSLIYDVGVDLKIKVIASRALTDLNVPEGDSPWLTEYFQKESLIIPLSDLPSNSLVFISDLDEFWNPESHFKVTRSSTLIFKQIPYIYFMNCRSDESWRNWTGTCLAESATFLETGVNAARTHNRLNRKVVRNGGWHFSYQGGRIKLLEKLEANTHQEYNKESIRDNLEVNLGELRDLRSTNANLVRNDSKLPPFAARFRDEHPDWFIV